MNSKKKIAIIVGTRPEAIKLAPLYIELKKSDSLDPYIWATGQHNQMLVQTLNAFEIEPDFNLQVMTHGQTLSSLTAKIIEKIDPLFLEQKPDFAVVQGDTTTAMASSVVSFYHKVPICHVEAGLRTATKFSPYPEELNRRLVSVVADYHFPPTEWAFNNLIKEGYSKVNILLTGNTVIDALSFIVNKVSYNPPKLDDKLNEKIKSGKKIILITGHRRENFGKGFEDLCTAIKTLALENTDCEFVYPVHLNPNVQEPVNRILSGINNILLAEPLEYEPFVYIMSKCYFIISDSGGIQEEAPHLGKPVLVMRESTERPEAIEAGTAKLVGTSQESIIQNARILLNDHEIYKRMSNAKNPYGDGTASIKIRQFLENLS